jgi:lycopene cyclase domain-containing protein
MGKYTYLFLDLASVLFPFLLSFDKKVAFYKQWKGLFAGIGITGTFFILWDIWFTANGIWSFNPAYITGIYIFNLPLEEVLFFICVPYASVFIYACYKVYFSFSFSLPMLYKLLPVLSVIIFSLAVYFHAQLYTLVNFSIGAVFILMHAYIFKKPWLGKFMVAYLLHLLPFFLVNGVLTALPVVMYAPEHIMGIRIGTVPAEETVYSLVLMLGVVTVMEKINISAPKH